MKNIIFLFTFLNLFNYTVAYSQPHNEDIDVFLKRVVHQTGWKNWELLSSLELHYVIPSNKANIEEAYKLPSMSFSRISQGSIVNYSVMKNNRFYDFGNQDNRITENRGFEQVFPRFTDELMILNDLYKAPLYANQFHLSVQTVDSVKFYVLKQVFEGISDALEGEVSTYYYYDTLLKHKSHTSIGTQNAETFFEDWHNVNGYWIPFKERINNTYKILENVKFNEPVDNHFVLPNNK